MKGTFPYWGAGNVVDYVDRFLFDEPLVLLGEDGAPFFECDRDVAFAVNGPIWVNNHIHVLRPLADRVEQRYLAHALNAVDYGRFISGSTRDKLTQEDMLRITINLPGTVAEQATIADFLDDQLTRLHEGVALWQKTSELLTERLQSELLSLVFGGAQLEGREKGRWHGTVSLAAGAAVDAAPAKWRRVRLKSVARRSDDVRGQRDIPLLSLASSGALYPRDMERQPPAEESLPRFLVVHPGDLVVNPMWLIGGAVAVSTEFGCVSPDYRVFRLHDDVCPRFLHHVMRTRPYIDQYRLYTRADTTFDRRVQQADLDNLPLALPPSEKQRVIAARLDDLTGAVEEGLRLATDAVSLLAERKRALVTAAVNGELDPFTMSERAGKVAIT